MADQPSLSVLAENVSKSRFRVYNRLVATKPLTQLVSILGYEESDEDDPDSTLNADGSDTDNDDDDDDRIEGSLYLASVLRKKVFGIRLGIKVESPTHILVVDAAVEYRWKTAIARYERDQLEQFAKDVAASRVSIGAWTVLEEMAATVDFDLKQEMFVPPSAVVDAVMHYYDQDAEAEPLTNVGTQ